jgi:hypothetical protein
MTSENRRANLMLKNYEGQMLAESIFEACNLREAKFQNANLEGSNFWLAELTQADFRGADLRRANLDSVKARGADFRGADLRGANLCGANLTDADFRGADLRGANLRGAEMQCTEFRGADLRGAQVGIYEDRVGGIAGARLFDGAYLDGAIGAYRSPERGLVLSPFMGWESYRPREEYAYAVLTEDGALMLHHAYNVVAEIRHVEIVSEFYADFERYVQGRISQSR